MWEVPTPAWKKFGSVNDYWGCLLWGVSALGSVWSQGVSGPRGVSGPMGGVCYGGVWVSQHALRKTPSPLLTESQTPVKTLPWPNFVATGNYNPGIKTSGLFWSSYLEAQSSGEPFWRWVCYCCRGLTLIYTQRNFIPLDIYKDSIHFRFAVLFTNFANCPMNNKSKKCWPITKARRFQGFP